MRHTRLAAVLGMLLAFPCFAFDLTSPSTWFGGDKATVMGSSHDPSHEVTSNGVTKVQMQHLYKEDWLVTDVDMSKAQGAITNLVAGNSIVIEEIGDGTRKISAIPGVDTSTVERIVSDYDRTNITVRINTKQNRLTAGYGISIFTLGGTNYIAATGEYVDWVGVTNAASSIVLRDVPDWARESVPTVTNGFVRTADLPTMVSDLTNDAEYVTAAVTNGILGSAITYADDSTNALYTAVTGHVADVTKDFVTESVTNGLAPVSAIPTKVSQLTNDTGYVYSVQAGDGISVIPVTGGFKVSSLGISTDTVHGVELILQSYDSTNLTPRIDAKLDSTNAVTLLDVMNVVDSATSPIVQSLANKADKANNLAGYGIKDAYTKGETESKIRELASVPGDYLNVSNKAVTGYVVATNAKDHSEKLATTVASYTLYFEDWATNNYQAARLANYRALRLETWQEGLTNGTGSLPAIDSATNGLEKARIPSWLTASTEEPRGKTDFDVAGEVTGYAVVAIDIGSYECNTKLSSLKWTDNNPPSPSEGDFRCVIVFNESGIGVSVRREVFTGSMWILNLDYGMNATAKPTDATFDTYYDDPYAGIISTVTTHFSAAQKLARTSHLTAGGLAKFGADGVLTAATPSSTGGADADYRDPQDNTCHKTGLTEWVFADGAKRTVYEYGYYEPDPYGRVECYYSSWPGYHYESQPPSTGVIAVNVYTDAASATFMYWDDDAQEFTRTITATRQRVATKDETFVTQSFVTNRMNRVRSALNDLSPDASVSDLVRKLKEALED